MINVLILLLSSICFASITGVVVDERGLPVEGVSIEVELDSSQYKSDSLGQFEIDLDELVSSKTLKLEVPNTSKYYNVSGQIQNPNLAEGVYLSKNKEHMIKKQLLNSSEIAVARLKFSKVGYLDTLINVDSLNQNLGDVELRDDVAFFTDQLDSLLCHYDSLYYDHRLNELLSTMYDDSRTWSPDTAVELEYFSINYISRYNHAQENGAYYSGTIEVTSKKAFGLCDVGSIWKSIDVTDSSYSAIYHDDACYLRKDRDETFYEASQRGVRSVESFFIQYDSLKIETYLNDLEELFIQYPDSVMNTEEKYVYTVFNLRIDSFLNDEANGWIYRNDSVIFKIDSNLTSDQNCFGGLSYVYEFDVSKEGFFLKTLEPSIFDVSFCENREELVNQSALSYWPMVPFSSSINEYRIVEQYFYRFRKTSILYENYKGFQPDPNFYLGYPNSRYFSWHSSSDSGIELGITAKVVRENCPVGSSVLVKLNLGTNKLDVVDEATACPEMLEMVDRVNNRPL